MSIAALSSPSRCWPSSSPCSAARCARSETRTSPSSPRVQVTRVTAAPSDTYFAMVAPLPIVSSSGWAWTSISRRAGSSSRVGELTTPPYSAGDQAPRRSTAGTCGARTASDDDHGFGEMAGRSVVGLAVGTRDQQGLLYGAHLLRLPAAGVEAARPRRGCGGGAI